MKKLSYRLLLILLTGIIISVSHTASRAEKVANISVVTTPSWQDSISRSLSARLGDRVSVKDFGAQGDGLTDDTKAVQNAVDAICALPGGVAPWGSGGNIFFPSGVYPISSIKIPCNGISLIGSNNGNTNSSYLDWRGTVLKLKTLENKTAFMAAMVDSDYGGGVHISHLSIDGSDMNPTAFVFDFSWLQHSTIEDISALNISNFFREEGGAANSIVDVNILNLSGIGVEYFGDASQCGSNNPSVTLSVCNKRADLLRVTRVNMNGTSNHTATCFSYHDFAQSLNVDHVICENAHFGIEAHCSAAQGNNGEACPAFARFNDFEAENCTACIVASDIQDWEFSNGYFLGEGIGSTHVVSFSTKNFGTSASEGIVGSYTQAVRLHGGRFGNAARSVLYIGVSDFIVEGGQFFSSNLADLDNHVGAPNIEVAKAESATVPTRGILHSNILCEASGQQPIKNINDNSRPFIQGSIWLGPDVSNVKVFGNETSRCASGPQDFSGSSNNMIAPF